MSERRSARATKGQNKALDQLDGPVETPSKKVKSGKGGKANKKEQEPEEEVVEEEIIRCICGATEQDDNSDEAWISCEKCNVWQHNVCMGITTDEKELDNLQYYCEECKPQDHKETLAAIARGEEPWKQRQEDAAQGTHDSKKKKKGGKKRSSDVKAEVKSTSARTSATPKPETPQPDANKSNKPSPVVQTNGQAEDKDALARTISTKRKASEPQPDVPNKAKMRKVSSPPEQAAVTSISDLDTDRQGPAKLIHKLLSAAMDAVNKRNKFVDTPAELDKQTTELSLAIEKAAFEFLPKQQYLEQCRKVASNLKTNHELCERLVAKTLTPAALAAMTVDEMASKAQQEETARMKAIADRNAIMISEEGPRIRRTHKGEEVIEDQRTIATAEEMPAVQRRRSTMRPDEDMPDRSRDGTPGDAVELPEDVGYQARQMSATTLGTATTPPLPRKESTVDNFDIGKVFSSVQPPSTTTQRARVPSRQLTKSEGPGEDADIDRMLEDGNESPPYSPAEYDSDPSIIWRGHMQMTSIASYPAIGRYVGGADPKSFSTAFTELIPETLTVAGRIDVDRATEYLCSLRYSPPTDIVVIAITPTGETATEEANKLSEYFVQKKKYGVVGNKIYANVRDTYLIPVAAGDGPLPEFLMNIEGHNLTGPRPENIILVTMVIRHPFLEGENSTPSAQPNTPHPPVSIPQRQMSMSTGPTMSPVDRQHTLLTTPGGTPTAHEPQSSTPYVSQSNNDNHEVNVEAYRQGVQVAREILGDLVHSPTVNFLLPQAGSMEASEWTVIKNILLSDELARHDLPHLSKLLQGDGKA